jgi:dienelactone hydrolase
MRRLTLIAGIFGISLATSALAQQPATSDSLTAAVKKIDPHVVPEDQREALRSMLGRSLREQIAAANRKSSAEWTKITSREEWERFRDEKIAALRKSLGTLPPHPRPQSREARGALVTRELPGEGFKIKNLVYESRPGLVVTANLYVPEPARKSMPGIILAHSHHNPKTEGELQDMGMTWARAGCYVLVPDALGHGERRQHPFASAADYPREFPVSRQDYNFRYDTSLQLYLVGESLMGWMVHDLMTGVDVLLAQPGCDEKRIILLGAVAGGGDPAGVTAVLDPRIACVVPFNFGGPQPENRYPLPEDAETSFNYAGGGSWESTRNLAHSAEGGFLPWVIVGSVAPRRLVHAHEFSWDRERDPVWKRYEKIFGLYGAAENLSFAHGFGAIQVNDPPGSHCNNIGAAHRKQIHEAFAKWFDIRVTPENEYKNRRPKEDLYCLTDAAINEFQPKKLHTLLGEIADQQLETAREKLAQAEPTARRKLIQDHWTRLIGDTVPAKDIKVIDGTPRAEQIDGVTINREVLETEPGILVPVMMLSLAKGEEKADEGPRLAIGIAPDGIAGILKRQSNLIAEGLNAGFVVVLPEVRGTGASGSDDHGQQSAATSYSATNLMLGRTTLGGQLRDLRAVLRHVRKRHPKVEGTLVVGGSGIEPLAADAAFSYPRRVDRPAECQPTGALLALLLGLYEEDVNSIVCRRGLASYRSVLDSPFVQVPHECIVPGVFQAGDLQAVIDLLGDQEYNSEFSVDGRGRLAADK